VLVSAHDRNAAIFTFRGANTLLEPADLRKDAFAVDLVYVAGLSNQSADCFPHIVSMAKKEGAIVATNPGIRQLSSKQGDFLKSLSNIDILAVNRTEAGALIPWLVGRFGEDGPTPHNAEGNVPSELGQGLSGGGFEMSLPGFFRAMRQLGPKWVLVSDGKNGAYVGAESCLTYCPAVQVKVVGTAGAGDALASTFASLIAGNASAEDALLGGVTNSASVVGFTDTQSGLLVYDALKEKMNEARKSAPPRTWQL
jgi:ribokinase